MPYIEDHERECFKDNLAEIVKNITSVGQLTYCIYYLMVNCLKQSDVFNKSHYKERSSVRACALDAAQEFWDKYIRSYEDKKEEENGSV